MHDRHHERGLRVPRARHDARGGVGVLLDEVRLDDNVTVLKRVQADSMAVSLPLGLRVVGHVHLAVPLFLPACSCASRLPFTISSAF